jgi:hypothetical protein
MTTLAKVSSGSQRLKPWFASINPFSRNDLLNVWNDDFPDTISRSTRM